MAIRENPLFWSFSCGTWFLTRVRVSFYLLILTAIICFQLGSLKLGLIVSGTLFFSLLVHEYAHIIAARFTGGMGAEILIWPLGGLAYVQAGPSKKSHFLVALAGVAANLLLVIFCLPATMGSEFYSQAMNPFLFPKLTFEGNQLIELQVLLFKINWLLFLVNLLPIYPLDGSKVIHAYFYHDWNQKTVQYQIVAFGMILAGIGMISGLAFNHVWMVFTCSVLLLINFYEMEQFRTQEVEEESFQVYDFSEGYSSFEEETEFDKQDYPQMSFLARWKERREVKEDQSQLPGKRKRVADRSDPEKSPPVRHEFPDSRRKTNPGQGKQSSQKKNQPVR